MKVSVVLPVYNGERYIRQSIMSVLGQTYSDFELIIVDDCSADATAEIATDFARLDSRVIYIRNEINKKLPGSLNVGFGVASGDFYTWTSDDNLLKPNFLECMIDKLKEGVHFVYSDYDIIDEAGQVQEVKSVELSDLLMSFNVVGASFMYTRDVANTIGRYDETLFLLEDYDYWVRVRESFSMQRLNISLYQYRVHKEALSSRRFRQIEVMSAKYILRRLRKGEYSKSERRESLFMQILRMRRAGCYFRAAGYFCHCLLASPVYLISRIVEKVSR